MFFDLVKIQTILAPQNEHQHLSFEKNIHVDGKKLSEMIVKLPNAKVVTFEYEQTIINH